MCSSYFLEESRELAGIAHAADTHKIKGKMIEQLGQPVLTKGEVSPGCIVPVIAPGSSGESLVYPMVWGFTGKASLITSAKTEAAPRSEIFKEAWRHRRCIIPASWYFEREHILPDVSYELTGNQSPDAHRCVTRQTRVSAGEENALPLGSQYLLQARSSAVTLLAGLYRLEEFRGMKFPHFVVLTKEAPEKLRFIHNRMPVVLRPTDQEAIRAWVNPWTDSSEVNRIIRNAVSDMVYEKRCAG